MTGVLVGVSLAALDGNRLSYSCSLFPLSYNIVIGHTICIAAK